MALCSLILALTRGEVCTAAFLDPWGISSVQVLSAIFYKVLAPTPRLFKQPANRVLEPPPGLFK
jgi:hypothetical protein